MDWPPPRDILLSVCDLGTRWAVSVPCLYESKSIILLPYLVFSARFFAGKYSVLYLGFLAGAVLPLIPWWLHRKYPKRSFDKVIFSASRLNV